MIDDADNGWVCIHRKMLDNPILTSRALTVWVILLLLATHKPKDVLFKGQRITLKPGQFLTGRRYLSEKTGISQTQVERVLQTFEVGQQIKQEKSNKNRLITIINWEKYQRKGQQTDNRRTTDGQQNNGFNYDLREGVKITKVQKKDTYNKTTSNKNTITNNSESGAYAPTLTPFEEARLFFTDKQRQDEIIKLISKEKKINLQLSEKQIHLFIAYWTERNKLGTKQRWEMEKTFEVMRRLTTWFSRVKDFKLNTTTSLPEALTREERLALYN